MPLPHWPRSRRTIASMSTGSSCRRDRTVCPRAKSRQHSSLTFHFDRLRGAGLVSVRREGRSMIYAARYDTMNELLGYLTENCCQGRAGRCVPAARMKRTPAPARRKEPVT